MKHVQTYVAKHAVVSNDLFAAELAFSADANVPNNPSLRLSLAVFDTATYKSYLEATNDHQREQCRAILLVKDMSPLQYNSLMELFVEGGEIDRLAQVALADPDVRMIIPFPAETPGS